MPETKPLLARPARGIAGVDIRLASLVWLLTWLVGNLLGSLVISIGGGSTGDGKPLWVNIVAAVSLWLPMLGGLWYLSDRVGSGSVPRDFNLRFQPIDLIGLPLGVLSQLVLLRLLYWPLEQWWPSTFGREHVERSARSLSDAAHGGGYVLLVLVVVVGAPFVEELMYRGLLQGAFTRRLNDVVGVVLVAAWFAIVHFRPVEYPGLFVFGLVLGVCALRTRRLGMSVLTHMAFNATGLILVVGK